MLVVGLMDDVKKRSLQYISVTDFLFYLAYTQGEQVSTVVAWLYAEDFEKSITSYIIDKNYKIIEVFRNDDSQNFDISTDRLFKELQEKSFNHLLNEEDEENKYFKKIDPSYYSFSYRIKDLNQFSYIKKLELDFNLSRSFFYNVHIDNYVSAREREKGYFDDLYIYSSCSTKSELGKAEDKRIELDAELTKFNSINKKINDIINQALEESENCNISELESDVKENTKYSYLTTIGLLLELMQTPKWGLEGNKPPFQSQSAIINEILEKSIKGQGRTTLENRFSEANLILADAKKKNIDLPR